MGFLIPLLKSMAISFASSKLMGGGQQPDQIGVTGQQQQPQTPPNDMLNQVQGTFDQSQFNSQQMLQQLLMALFQQSGGTGGMGSQQPMGGQWPVQ